MTTDSDLGSVNSLMSFASGLKGIGPDKMHMVTMPVIYDPADANRVLVEKGKAQQVWTALKRPTRAPRLRRHRARARPGGAALARARPWKSCRDGRALKWTRKNMEGSRVDLRQGDALTAFPDLDGQVDLVVSNPPYIPLTEWEYVAPEARDHDPELALFSGEDGLDLIRGLERTAHRLLRPGGVVVVEHADTQGGQVPWIFTEERGWADAADHPDLNNRPRFATARKALP
ncbi:Release factor glutamine methyltransferase [Streptomyces tendae]